MPMTTMMEMDGQMFKRQNANQIQFPRMTPLSTTMATGHAMGWTKMTMTTAMASRMASTEATAAPMAPHFSHAEKADGR